ncbi:MAG: type II toxin-antitoxin system RelE/ParE family toxin [Bacteroidetes bacterium]|jgi:toxin ParE1/3/4|nr:type II toxin-antitoxin system RelE/ParE family toxin [Bacteroidota bacterium]
MRKYTLTRKAEDDIREIWTYTLEEWDEEQAEIYLNGLESKIKEASENPDTIGQARPDIKSGYMSFLYESHIVFFRKEMNYIVVVRVLHQKMDIQKRLP